MPQPHSQLTALHVGHAATAKGLGWMARPAEGSRKAATPAVSFDGHIARPTAQESEAIAKDLADNLRLEFEPLMLEEGPDSQDEDLDFGM